MPVAQWVLKHNMMAKAMRKVDPSIKLIAGGAMPDAMTGSKQAKRLNGQIVPDYLSPGDWSGNLLAHCLDNMDMLSEHFYSRSDQQTDLTTGEKVPTGPQALVEWERWPATQVRSKYEHYQEYLKRIPALKDKPVPISSGRMGIHWRPAEFIQSSPGVCLGISGNVSSFRSLPTGRVHLRDCNDQ